MVIMIPMKRLIIITAVLLLPANVLSFNTPKNLWKALIAEAAGEGTTGMYAVACVVRNRLNAGMDPGLCGAHRKDLNTFVARQGKKIEHRAKAIVEMVFYKNGDDITDGAVYFESTDYPENIKKFDAKYKRVMHLGKHIFYK